MGRIQRLLSFAIGSGLLLGMAPLWGSALAATLGPISEEQPPAVCDPGWFLSGIQCTGSYCDNIKIACARLNEADLGRAEWTRWISEEGGTRECPANHYIAGLACNGKYCDNISLYCVEVKNYRSIACSNTRSVSEEGGGILSFLEGIDKAGQQMTANSMRCTGKYCDNKQFNVCEVSKR